MYEAEANNCNFLNLSAVLSGQINKFFSIHLCLPLPILNPNTESARITASHTVMIKSRSEDQSFRIKCTGFEFEAK
jgi:hypothetical protein